MNAKSWALECHLCIDTRVKHIILPSMYPGYVPKYVLLQLLCKAFQRSGDFSNVRALNMQLKRRIGLVSLERRIAGRPIYPLCKMCTRTLTTQCSAYTASSCT